MNNFNFLNKNIYQGRNQGELEAYRIVNNFKSEAWLTFLQAKSLGLRIKKGSKSIGVFRGFESFTNKDKDGKLKTESRPLGFARVFNLDQTEKIQREEVK